MFQELPMQANAKVRMSLAVPDKIHHMHLVCDCLTSLKAESPTFCSAGSHDVNQAVWDLVPNVLCVTDWKVQDCDMMLDNINRAQVDMSQQALEVT